MRGTRVLAASAMAAATLLVSLVLGAGPAAAKGTTPASPLAVAYTDISSSGPLTHVYLGSELSCQIAHSGDTSLELYPPSTVPGDCGTFVLVNGTTLVAPDFPNHGTTATGNLGSYTRWTPVSQSAVTGTGTAGDPFRVTTIASAPSVSLRVTEVDTYVVGQESYTTSVTVTNEGTSGTNLVLYRAGDCFLGGSDFGNGQVTGSAIACVQPSTSRIEEWVPITAGSSYYEDFYGSVWAKIGSHTPFNNTCTCSTYQDNGAGLSWSFSLAAGNSATYSQVTTFSPTGVVPVTTAKTADSATVAAGGQDGYTITFTNPNASAVTLSSIVDTLPIGFTYVNGSTTGATTADPSVSGQTLTWNGSFSISGNGTLSLHFLVTAPTQAGDYFNEAGGTAGSVTVVPTGPTAQITVQSGNPNKLPTTLRANPSIARVIPGFRVYFPNLSATLTSNGEPVPGKRIGFSVNGNKVCAAKTNSAGYAACGGVLPEARVTLNLGYLARFAGDATYDSALDHGELIVVFGKQLLA